MDISDTEKAIEVFDRDRNTLYKGEQLKAIEWIINNPVIPDVVRLEGSEEFMMIDVYLRAWDEYWDL